jgi:hypothetical protein
MPRGNRARRTSRCNIAHLLEIRSGLFLSFVILPKMIKRTKPLAAEGTGTWNSVWPSRMIIAPFGRRVRREGWYLRSILDASADGGDHRRVVDDQNVRMQPLLPQLRIELQHSRNLPGQAGADEKAIVDAVRKNGPVRILS